MNNIIYNLKRDIELLKYQKKKLRYQHEYIVNKPEFSELAQYNWIIENHIFQEELLKLLR